jgi:hypothetical protein
MKLHILHILNKRYKQGKSCPLAFKHTKQESPTFGAQTSGNMSSFLLPAFAHHHTGYIWRCRRITNSLRAPRLHRPRSRSCVYSVVCSLGQKCTVLQNVMLRRWSCASHNSSRHQPSLHTSWSLGELWELLPIYWIYMCIYYL